MKSACSVIMSTVQSRMQKTAKGEAKGETKSPHWVFLRANAVVLEMCSAEADHRYSLNTSLLDHEVFVLGAGFPAGLAGSAVVCSLCLPSHTVPGA